MLTLYPDWTAWEADIKLLEARTNAFVGLRGTLAAGGSHLLRACEFNDEIGALQQRLFRYVQMQSDVNTADADVKVRMHRMREVLDKSSNATAWFAQEVQQLPLSGLKPLIEGTPSLHPYRFFLVAGSRPADIGFSAAPRETDIAREADDAVLAYVRLSTEGSVQLGTPHLDARDTPDAEAYFRAVTSERDSTKRARAAQAYFNALERNQNTYCELYRKVLQRDWAIANVRRQSSSFGAAVSPTGYSLAQMSEFLEEVRRNTAPLREYQALRKRILKLDCYRQCDRALPLWSEGQRCSYADAQQILLSATAPLGPHYAQKLKSLFNPGWIDLYPSAGKRSGSYTAGVYRMGAFELINYRNDLRSLFSFAHESGHGVHLLLCYDVQPFCTSEPPVFVAETAAMLNEQLVYRMLADHRREPAAQRELLDFRARMIESEFYRQAMTADFEIRAHRFAEQNVPVTAAGLNELFATVLHDYNGDSFSPDALENCEWAGNPHLFTSPFYVYQYATSFAISSDISRRISAEPVGWNPAGYIAMLKLGGAGRPRDLIEAGGIAWDGQASARAVAEELAGIVSRLRTISQD
jgi:oligoendopeptidase F